MSAPPSKEMEEEVYDEDDLGGTGCGEDETFAEDHQDAGNSDRSFDEIVGALESMLMDDEFTNLQSSYLDEHCHEFEASDENKLSYTAIFDNYVSRMETFIDGFLSRRIEGFSMESFLEECESRGEDQLCGDAFEVLTCMSDFESFKALMLDHQQRHQWVGAGPQSPTAKARPQATTNSAAGSS